MVDLGLVAADFVEEGIALPAEAGFEDADEGEGDEDDDGGEKRRGCRGRLRRPCRWLATTKTVARW